MAHSLDADQVEGLLRPHRVLLQVREGLQHYCRNLDGTFEERQFLLGYGAMQAFESLKKAMITVPLLALLAFTPYFGLESI